MGQGQARRAIAEFARFLNGNWQREVILIETLRIFEEVIGCIRASGYLVENGSFELKAKIGMPILLDSLEVIDSINGYASIFNNKEHYCEAVALNDRGLYVTPLVSGKDTLGLILFEMADTDPSQMELAGVTATVSSMALINAWLAEERANIDDIVSSFASGHDLEDSYPMFAEKMKQVVPFDLFSIVISDPFQNNQLMVYHSDENGFRTGRIPYIGSGSALVISTGNAIIEQDLADCRNFIGDEILLDRGIRCVLRAPLISRGKTFGTLNVSTNLPNVYTKREIDLVTEIAGKIGPAVENAMVYDSINKKLSQALIQIENNYSATLNAIAVMLDKRDTRTMGHSFRVIEYASAIAEKMGVCHKELENIRLGSLLHDIGKIAIPDAILFKPSRLNEQEFSVMRTHPKVGAEMVSKIEFLVPAMPIVLHHHEWFNGNGYPKGLKKEEIPLGARVFAVADAFDAMTSDRPYRAGLPIERAMQELAKCKASQFCPECVDAFNQIPETKLTSIYKECQSEVTFRSPELAGQDLRWEVARNLAYGK